MVSSGNNRNGIFLALRSIFYLITAVQFWYAIYYDVMFVAVPSPHRMANIFGGKFKYLTFLDCVSILICIFTNKSIYKSKTNNKMFKQLFAQAKFS